MNLVSLFFDQSFTNRLGEIGDTVSDYFASELEYSSAVALLLFRHLLLVLALGAVGFGIFFALLVQAVLSVSIYYHSIALDAQVREMTAWLYISLGLLFLVVATFLWFSIRRIRLLVRDFGLHWRS